MTTNNHRAYIVDSTGKRIVLRNLRVLSIGRTDDNNVVLSDDTISRHHAIVIWKDGEFWLRDLSSANGTYINGCGVSERRLQHGDSLRFGNVDLGTFRSRRPILKRVATIGSFLAVVSGISYFAANRLLRQWGIGSIKTPTGPVATIRSSGSVSSNAVSDSGDITVHDITSMAYVLCTEKLRYPSAWTDLPFNCLTNDDAVNAALEIYMAVVRGSGQDPNAAAKYTPDYSGRLRIATGDLTPASVCPTFSYPLEPSSRIEQCEEFDKSVMDWAVKVKQKTEKEVPQYIPMVGESFVDPRGSLKFDEEPESINGVEYPALSITIGPDYRFMGEFKSASIYHHGDIVLPVNPEPGTPSAVVFLKDFDGDRLPDYVTSIVSDRTDIPYLQFPTLIGLNDVADSRDSLCAALNYQVAKTIGDPVPIGGYGDYLVTVKNVRSIAPDVTNLMK